MSTAMQGEKTDQNMVVEMPVDNLDNSILADVDGRPKRTLKRRILTFMWDSLDKAPEERAFLRKIDFWIMLYVSTTYMVKYLDQRNVTNAYVSGMKEDLKMSGNQYNYLQTMYTVGYCIGNIPSNLMMTRIRPSLWLPSIELLWGFLVMAMAGIKTIKGMYVLRFFIGLLEASAYPGIITLLGNWYTPQELGKRSSIFIASAGVAQMFSGYLQAALYSGMNGRLGLPAWRWLFIFDGVIGIPIYLFGYWAIPDSPTTCRVRWLKPHERELAVFRMEQIGRAPPRKMTWRVVRDIFTDWPVYLFSVTFSCHLLGIRVYNYFSVYLKSTGRYTIEQINILPTAGYGVFAGTTLLWAWISDGTGHRTPMIVCASVASLVGAIILSIYPSENETAMMAGWMLTFSETGAAALILTYINELLSFSTEQRLLVISVVETVGFVMNAWVILFVYNSGQAPRFSVGYQMAAMFFSVEILSMCAISYCARRWKPKDRDF